MFVSPLLSSFEQSSPLQIWSWPARCFGSSVGRALALNFDSHRFQVPSKAATHSLQARTTFMARLPLLSNIQPAMPAVIPSVKMGPRASLSWARRTTPAAASLDSLDSTVAPTLTSVRRDLVLRTLLVKMGSTHSDVCAAMAMTHPTALRQLATMKVWLNPPT